MEYNIEIWRGFFFFSLVSFSFCWSWSLSTSVTRKEAHFQLLIWVFEKILIYFSFVPVDFVIIFLFWFFSVFVNNIFSSQSRNYSFIFKNWLLECNGMAAYYLPCTLLLRKPSRVMPSKAIKPWMSNELHIFWTAGINKWNFARFSKWIEEIRYWLRCSHQWKNFDCFFLWLKKMKE